ncbi:MAG: hypothetical protein JWM72_1531 [Actinomycetia bacterium]|nr:hypothetical protein [Actinomycetes bacterium]
MTHPALSPHQPSRAFRPGSARPRARRVPTLALAVLVSATISAWLGGTEAAVAEPLQSAPSDQLRIVAVDTSAFPDVTATIALPISMHQDQDLSANLTVATAATPLRADVYRVSRDRPTVAILLDADGRTGTSTFTAEQGAAAEWILELDPTLPVVIGTSTSGIVTTPAVGTGTALAAIGKLQLGGTRNWPRALGAVMAVTTANSRAVVVVVSTGPGNAPAAPSELTSRTAGAEVSVRWIRLSANAGPSDALGKIPSVESTPDALLGTLNPIAADLTAQYQLRFRANPTATTATVTLDAYGTRWTARAGLESSVQPPSGPTGHRAPSSNSDGFFVAIADNTAGFINAHRIFWDILGLAVLLYLARDLRRS